MEPNDNETLPILDTQGENWPTEYTGAQVVQGEHGAYFLAPTVKLNRYTDTDAAAVDAARVMTPVSDPLATILESNARVEDAVNRLVNAVDNVAKLAGQIEEQIGPTLQGLQSNPMFKMMFGGKKNG